MALRVQTSLETDDTLTGVTEASFQGVAEMKGRAKEIKQAPGLSRSQMPSAALGSQNRAGLAYPKCYQKPWAHRARQGNSVPGTHGHRPWLPGRGIRE